MTSTKRGPHSPQSSDEQIGLEASQWLVCLTDTEPQPDDPYFDPVIRSAAFLAWITASTEHLEMFLDTYETHRRLENIDPSCRIDISALLRQAVEEVPAARRLSNTARHSLELNGVHRRLDKYLPHSRSVRWATVAAIVAAVTLLLATEWPFVASKDASAEPTAYTTTVGERRMVRLEDGSELNLNTASRVEVNINRRIRQVRLIYGEVLVTVKHEVARPFLVESNDVRILDIGTQFDVYKRESGHIRVSVIKGRVHLTCACDGQINRPTTISANSIDATLSEGDEVNVVVDGRTATLDRRTRTAEDFERVLAWKEGHLNFKGEPLTEVIQEFNRYNARHFVITDPSIASYPIAGYFPSPNPDNLLEVLHEHAISALAIDVKDPSAIRLIKKPE
jgi:ferric-dicitrate binding protein FerR (iron transport regulator)